MNFIFLKFFLIVCFSKTIICDSSVIIPLGVMLVNHKIQIFLDFSKFHPKAPIQFPGQDAPRPLPSPARVLSFFLSVGNVSQRERISVRARTPSGDTTKIPEGGWKAGRQRELAFPVGRKKHKYVAGDGSRRCPVLEL